MAYSNKLIHFLTKANFETQLENNNILDTSICFIQDTKQIWTHGQYYSCPYSQEEIDQLFKGSNILLTGYVETVSPINIYASDTVNNAFSKIEEYLTILNNEKLDKVEAQTTYQPIGDYLVSNDLSLYATQEFVLDTVEPKVDDAASDGKVYGRQNGQWAEIQKIYSELGIPKERFEELLYRQYIVPTLLSAPTENTLQWADGNYTISFEIGDYCRVEDTENEDLGYKFYRLFNITSDGKAVWSDQSDPGDEIGETILVSLQSNQSTSDSSLIGATVTINDTTAGKTLYTTQWTGSSITVSGVPANHQYQITVTSVDGYKTPDAFTETAIEGAIRQVNMTYETCLVTVTLNTNQSSNTDIANAKFTLGGVSYSSGATVKVAFGTTVEITCTDVTGYTTPQIDPFEAASNTQTITATYRTTILTVLMDDNQSSYNDITNATATVTATGISSTTLSSGGTVKIPTGTTDVEITWSDVTGYKTPTLDPFTATDASMSKTGTYQTEILTVTVSGASGYTITISNVGTQTTSPKTYKVPFGTKYAVTASSIEDYTVAISNSATITANAASRSITVTYTAVPVTDLSMYDIYGTSHSQTTANCYVVKTKGNYKFPCVYGNAISGGATNATAYKNNGGSYSHNFVNYKGSQITSPYIATDTGETISSAQLTIADTNNIITNVSVTGSGSSAYVKFTVASVPNTGANAVISIKNSSGTIMWNWHIWVWKDSLATVTITNSTSNTYNILPVNLASKWVSSSSYPTQITNWYYQWGRSVPLAPATTYNSTTNATTYGALSYSNVANSSGSYQQGITNPTIHYGYGNNSNYNWFGSSGSYYNLWDQACTSTGCSDNIVVKTVYDPCPPGFKMPNGNTFTGFSSSNVVGSFSNGYYFKKNSSDTSGVFFPASGYRYYSSGSLSDVGSYGCVWSAAAYSQYYAYYLSFLSGYVSPQNYGNRAFGLSVRPVAES